MSNVLLHTSYCGAYDHAFSASTMAEPGEIVFIIGPTGAGKSTICLELSKALTGSPEMWALGMTHVIYHIIGSSENSYFSSKDLFERLAEQLGDEFAQGDGQRAEKRTRRAVEKLGIARQLRYLILDEANLMCMTTRQKKPVHHLESLRIVCKRVGAVLILSGTVTILQLWNNSAQLNRVMFPVPIPTYGSDAEGLSSVLALVDDIVQREQLPLASADLLSSRVELIVRVTAGVYGEIRNLIRRMKVHQARLRRDVADHEVFEASLPAEDQLNQLHAEAHAIQIAMRRVADDRDTKKRCAPRATAQNRKKRARRKPRPRK